MSPQLENVCLLVPFLVQWLLSASAISTTQGREVSFDRKDFYVDGSSIPGLAAEVVIIGPSYAGLLPVRENNNSREPWLWLVKQASKPRANPHPHGHQSHIRSDSDHGDLIIWMNGGPGGSSFGGALTENGPFLIETLDDKNTSKATVNPWSWHHLADILYLECPIGVGFTRGDPDILDMPGFAKELLGFYKNFLIVFPEYRTRKIWFVGESYASNYAVYSTSRFLDAGIDVRSIGMVSGALTADYWDEICVLPFVERTQKQLHLTDATISKLRNTTAHQRVGEGWVTQHLQKPLKGPVLWPAGYEPGWHKLGLDLPSDIAYDAASLHNDCFNPYHITDRCPQYATTRHPVPKLEGYGDPKKKDFGSVAFRKHFHMPLDVSWVFANTRDVFLGGPCRNESLSPALADDPLFGNVIDRLAQQDDGKVVLMAGGLDFSVTYESAQLGVANTTFGGLQGFQEPRSDHWAPLRVDGKTVGTHHTERGLTLAYASQSGHEMPRYTPKAAFKLMQFLLGQIGEKDLSS